MHNATALLRERMSQLRLDSMNEIKVGGHSTFRISAIGLELISLEHTAPESLANEVIPFSTSPLSIINVNQ